MNTPQRLILTPISLLLLMAACATPLGNDPTTEPPEPTETADPTTSPVEAPSEETDTAMPGRPQVIPDDVWAILLAELSDLGVASNAPTIVAAEEVTWSDGSLGCPQPNMGYTQALVPGYRVVLEVDGEEFHFHASESDQVILCDDPQPPVDDGAVDR